MKYNRENLLDWNDPIVSVPSRSSDIIIIDKNGMMDRSSFGLEEDVNNFRYRVLAWSYPPTRADAREFAMYGVYTDK